MAKNKKILCTTVECIKLRENHSVEELAWAKDVADFYVARPLNKKNAECFYEFVADVFHAGRISGVREERAKKQKKGVAAQ